mgnify:CR=1 FL=1
MMQLFIFRCGIGQLRDDPARDRPEIQARDGAVGRIAAAAVEGRAVDLAPVVEHAHPAPDGEVAVADHVRPLHAEREDHLRRPRAHAVEIGWPMMWCTTEANTSGSAARST